MSDDPNLSDSWTVTGTTIAMRKKRKTKKKKKEKPNGDKKNGKKMKKSLPESEIVLMDSDRVQSSCSPIGRTSHHL